MGSRFPGHALADRQAALEFSLHMLVRTLHERGRLDTPRLLDNLRNAEWLFADIEPGILAAVNSFAAGIHDMQQRSTPPWRLPKN